MITPNEVSRNVYGVWQVILDRPDAERYFDTGYAGFWRSFQAIVLVAPLYVVVFASAYRSLAEVEPPVAITATGYFWLKAANVGLDWIALPLVLALSARFLGITRTYTSFVVVRNWAAVPIVAILAVISALEMLLPVLTDLLVWIQLLTIMVAIRLTYLMARRFLDVDISLAVALVVFDFLLSIVIVLGINLAFGLPALI